MVGELTTETNSQKDFELFPMTLMRTSQRRSGVCSPLTEGSNQSCLENQDPCSHTLHNQKLPGVPQGATSSEYSTHTAHHQLQQLPVTQHTFITF